MTPTPEQIGEMERRGWRWDGRRFRARAGIEGSASGTCPLWASVRLYDAGWIATYGAASHDWSGDMDGHATPELAAEEAEAWLRTVLSGFAFPWLQIRPVSKSDTTGETP